VGRRADIRQIEICTTDSLVPDPSSTDVDIAIINLKLYKSPGIAQIPSELIQTGLDTLLSDIYRLIISNKEELSDQWKKSIIVQIYKNSSETDYNKYSGTSLLSTLYIILPAIFLSRLSTRTYRDEIIGGHQCGF
jgi:hypothetical protein